MSGFASREAKRTYQREWLARRRADFFAGKHCVWPVAGSECGSTVGLQLDHVDPTQKATNRIWSWSAERRAAELAKCQVLCPQHHLEKTRANAEQAHPGELNSQAVLTAEQVLEMRRLRAEGLTYTELGRRFGVSRFGARNAVVRRWQHLPTC